MNEMRRNYHKDLNNNENFEAQMKKRMERGSRNGGVLGVSDELLESIENNTHFFEATDNIPADVKQLLNNKILKIKTAFEKSALSQMKYVESLNKKIYLYESMSSEFHALIEMPLADIFKGIQMMDHEAEELWTHIRKAFGDEFFLPTIGRLYGHLFVNDIERHQNEVQKALDGAKKNEKELVTSMTEQLNAINE